jgi:hypothetical protein
LSNSKPFFGVFGVWSEKEDGTGFEARMAGGYNDKVTRNKYRHNFFGIPFENSRIL